MVSTPRLSCVVVRETLCPRNSVGLREPLADRLSAARLTVFTLQVFCGQGQHSFFASNPLILMEQPLDNPPRVLTAVRGKNSILPRPGKSDSGSLIGFALGHASTKYGSEHLSFTTFGNRVNPGMALYRVQGGKQRVTTKGWTGQTPYLPRHFHIRVENVFEISFWTLDSQTTFAHRSLPMKTAGIH